MEPTVSPAGAGVRGIYATAYVAGSPSALKGLLDLIDATELNALVIDVKDVTGLTYPSRVHGAPLSRRSPPIPNLSRVLERCRERGVYTIARLCVFHDADLAHARPDLALRTPEGELWKDRSGGAWTDPYRREVWDYIVAVAVEVAALGFDEVQFDYVRFPTDGDLSRIVYPDTGGLTRMQAINGFLRQAREALRAYGVIVSADVFGLVCYTETDVGLGQYLEELMQVVDYLSPMTYPSHYRAGALGLEDPNRAPYETVYLSLLHARRRLAPEDFARIRPWLQDFSMGHRYGPDEVRAQIRATEDHGLGGWLLWNAASRYTPAALRSTPHRQVD